MYIVFVNLQHLSTLNISRFAQQKLRSGSTYLEPPGTHQKVNHYVQWTFIQFSFVMLYQVFIRGNIFFNGIHYLFERKV